LTQGIKYAGSKLKLLPYILSLSEKVKASTVFDGFSGSTRVSQAYAKKGCSVYANDIAVYSKVFNTAYLLNGKEPEEYQELIDYLNSLKPADGWFTENYGGGGGESAGSRDPEDTSLEDPNSGNQNLEDQGSKNGSLKSPALKNQGLKNPALKNQGLKNPWQRKNTRKLDAVREEIDRLKLDDITNAVCLTSLILALDQVDNTLGHYASYLNGWSRRSYKDLWLEVPKLWVNRQDNTVMNYDVFEAVDKLPSAVSLAYFDPPYGSNNEKMPPSRVRYASYYHIWTTICLNDRPRLFGRAKRREDTSDIVAASAFEEFRRGGSGRFICVEAIENLIKKTRADFIILSYSSGGRAGADELFEVLNSHGRVIDVNQIDYKKNVMSAMKWTNDWTRDPGEKNFEYLFLMEKR
jgi:adenine-specific DNA-methyltransferase